MPVAVVTDASVDLEPGWAAEHGISLAAVTHTVDGKRFTSGVQSAEELYGALARGADVEVLGVEPADYERAFRAAAERASEIVCVCQSFGSTFTYVSAEVAARRVESDGVKVHIVNTGRSGAAQAAIAIAGARCAASGGSFEEVRGLVETVAQRADTLLVVPSLEQLERAGQRTSIESQSRVGRLDEGVPLFRVRGRLSAVALCDDEAAAEATLIERAAELLGDSDAVLVTTHAAAPEAAQRLEQALGSRLRVSERVTTQVGPTLASLLGAGAYGAGFCALPSGSE